MGSLWDSDKLIPKPTDNKKPISFKLKGDLKSTCE